MLLRFQIVLSKFLLLKVAVTVLKHKWWERGLGHLILIRVPLATVDLLTLWARIGILATSLYWFKAKTLLSSRQPT